MIDELLKSSVKCFIRRILFLWLSRQLDEVVMRAGEIAEMLADARACARARVEVSVQRRTYVLNVS